MRWIGRKEAGAHSHVPTGGRWVGPLVAAIASFAACAEMQPTHAAAQNAFPGFRFQSYMGRCMDVRGGKQGAGSAVIIRDCNPLSAAQQLGIEEFLAVPGPPGKALFSVPPPPLPHDHQVRLHVGGLCVAANGPLASGTPIALATCAIAPEQLFDLDGDSILLDANRSLVIQLKDAVTAAGTPLVLGNRLLSDTELWDATAADGSERPPTSAFETAGDPATLQQMLAGAGPNTVIQIPPGTEIDYDDLPVPLAIPQGVTLRGDRRGVLLGPLIWLKTGHDSRCDANQQNCDDPGLFAMAAPDSRITGLRLQGPGRAPNGHQPAVKGINGTEGFAEIVDRNDLSDWTLTAVDLKGGEADQMTCPSALPKLAQLIHVFRNHIHDNLQNHYKASEGYGLAAGSGAYPWVMGNMFQKNVHSITSDGYAYSGYAAAGNLFVAGNTSVDTDVHGPNGIPGDTHHDGGISGLGAQVTGNTYLRTATGTSQNNFSLRGVPCSGALATFVGNVTRLGVSDAVAVIPSGGSKSVAWVNETPDVPYVRVNSRFSASDPLKTLLVGNFDGDRNAAGEARDDLFLATGAAWYYSPGGNAEWRFLSAKTETADTLLIGDFDGDGRADVFTQIGDQWMVSWGGRSDWQLLSENHRANLPQPDRGMMDFVIGDFVGDSRADVFYADGTTWWVSDGGVGPFVPYATSGYTREKLAFGDFDGAGKIEVAGVVDNQWMYVPSQGVHQWTPLRPKLTDTMKGLIVADFDGDGIADIAGQIEENINGSLQTVWKISLGGRGSWTDAPGLQTLSTAIAIGRFDDQKGADVLVWDHNFWQLSSYYVAVPQRQSRQDMR